MLTRSELLDNPVVLALADGKDGRCTVRIERVRGSQIRMQCDCARNAQEGWCPHQVDLLCLRYDRVVDRDPEIEFQFEDIVMGTPLADVADELDMAFGDYQRAWQAFLAKRVVGTVAPGQLATVAELALDL